MMRCDAVHWHGHPMADGDRCLLLDMPNEVLQAIMMEMRRPYLHREPQDAIAIRMQPGASTWAATRLTCKRLRGVVDASVTQMRLPSHYHKIDLFEKFPNLRVIDMDTRWLTTPILSRILECAGERQVHLSIDEGMQRSVVASLEPERVRNVSFSFKAPNRHTLNTVRKLLVTLPELQEVEIAGMHAYSEGLAGWPPELLSRLVAWGSDDALEDADVPVLVQLKAYSNIRMDTISMRSTHTNANGVIKRVKRVFIHEVNVPSIARMSGVLALADDVGVDPTDTVTLDMALLLDGDPSAMLRSCMSIVARFIPKSKCRNIRITSPDDEPPASIVGEDGRAALSMLAALRMDNVKLTLSRIRLDGTGFAAIRGKFACLEFLECDPPV